MAVVATLVGATTTGCGDAGKAPSPRRTPATTASSDAGQDKARAAVLAAYSGMWSDLQTDALTANWQNPTLVHHASGKALLELDEELASESRDGLIGKGHAVLHPTVVDLTPESMPTSATVMDCADLRGFLKYVKATGELRDHNPGGTHLVQATVTVRDGTWKVSQLAIGGLGSC